VIHSAYDLLSQPPEAYLIVLAFATADGVLPIVPSESALITAGLLSVVGHLSLLWVITAGAVGAFTGDGISYGLGRFAGRPVQERFLQGQRAREAVAWAQQQFAQRGGLVILVGRYIPGGRTAATFTGGVVRYPYARFAVFDAVAGSAWATYAAILGYAGGRFFEHHAWIALLLAFAVAVFVAFGAEAVRRMRSARSSTS
jgi:membrane-associated protein